VNGREKKQAISVMASTEKQALAFKGFYHGTYDADDFRPTYLCKAFGLVEIPT